MFGGGSIASIVVIVIWIATTIEDDSERVRLLDHLDSPL